MTFNATWAGIFAIEILLITVFGLAWLGHSLGGGGFWENVKDSVLAIGYLISVFVLIVGGVFLVFYTLMRALGVWT